MEPHDRGLEGGITPVEWRPTPDMYRNETPEGREAYEASLRMTAALQPVIARGEPPETHAILG